MKRQLGILLSGRGNGIRGKGASLLVTVLIGLVAASITITIIRTSLDNSRETLSRRAQDVAFEKARENVSNYINKINNNNLYFLESVDALELSRRCKISNNNESFETIEPGNPWPERCGVNWEYVADNNSNYIVVLPPNKESNYMVVRSIVEIAGKSSGYEEILAMTGRKYGLVSESDLNVNVFTKGSGYLSLNGDAYINGNLNISGDAFLNNNTVYVDGLTTGVNSTATFINREVSSPNDFDNISSLGLNKGDLRSSYLNLYKISCKNSGEMFNSGDVSSDLCLKRDRNLKDFENEIKTIPSFATKILVIPEKASPDRIEIYYSDNNMNYSEQCQISGCSLRAEANASVRHPAKLSTWSYLGSFKSPDSGIIYSELDLYVGNCGEASLINIGNCDTHDEIAIPGIEPDYNYVFLAGSINKPKDIYLSGPISSGVGSLTVFSTGSIFIPFWATPTANLLVLEVNLLSLGYNDELIATIPNSPLSNAENLISNLELKGKVILASGIIDLDNVSNVSTILSNKYIPFVGVKSDWETLERGRVVGTALKDPIKR
jgi:hypothetical protein